MQRIKTHLFPRLCLLQDCPSPVKTIILIICTWSIASMSYAQSEYIDRSFGVDGTVSFKNDSWEYHSILGTDSLDNIYINSSNFDSLKRFRYYTMTKLDKQGNVIYKDRFLDDQDSTAQPAISNSVLMSISFKGGSSFVRTYDLDYQPLYNYIIPFLTYAYSLNIQKNGYLEGFIGETLFRFQPDGWLDPTFANEGLYQVSDTDENLASETGLNGWLKNEDESFTLSGITLDLIDSTYKPISIKLLPNGQLDTDYGDNGISIDSDNPSEGFFIYTFIEEETHDGGYLINIYDYDSLYNSKINFKKLNKKGESESDFGQNGLMEFQFESDSSSINSYAILIGEMSDGSLLFTSKIRNYNNLITTEYLELYNQYGIKEDNFGINSILDPTAYIGAFPNVQILIDNDLYIINQDTIHYKRFTNSTTNSIRATETYITRLRTDKLLDYEPVAPPETSDFRLYPNPTSDDTMIEYSGPTLEDVNLYLYNMNGELLLEESIPTLYNYGEIPINAKDFPEGIYPLQIYDDGIKVWSTKIIKTK